MKLDQLIGWTMVVIVTNGRKMMSRLP